MITEPSTLKMHVLLKTSQQYVVLHFTAAMVNKQKMIYRTK